MDPAFTVENLGDARGRGVVASRDAPNGTVVFVTTPDAATLYSPYARTLCARCFADPSEAPSGSEAVFTCPQCDQFVLCARCHAAVKQEEQTEEHEDVACGGQPSQRRPSMKAVHRVACGWFNELPAAVRAPEQDTDYLRFCLDYGARRLLGDTRIRECLLRLESNAASQSEESTQFCTIFARDRIVATFARPRVSVPNTTALDVPRYTVPWEELRDVLLCTRCNSLGFPFNDDATTGWSLDATVCMLNHDCEPNVAVVMAEHDEACLRACCAQKQKDNDVVSSQSLCTEDMARNALAGAIGLKTIRDVRAGEELCISYVDSDDYDGDVMARTRHLLERFRFVCRCAKCTRQRAELKKK